MSDNRRLFTPGPLTTRKETREVMLKDWGSRDAGFIALTAELRARLLAIAHGENSHTVVPLQGSGTFIVEAAIATLVGQNDKLLVLSNGAYGERILAIAQGHHRKTGILRWAENVPVEAALVAETLARDQEITHVAIVHCETTTGLFNPLDEIATVVAKAGRVLIVDAMASFGAIDIDLRKTNAAAVLASSNKCLEGVPGIGFAVIDRAILESCKAKCPSLSLDLHAQWHGFESNGQWRFTPPVQVVAGFVKALQLLEEEGGPPARLARYRANFETLRDGMTRLGYKLYLDSAVQAPIIATFHVPDDPEFNFRNFYDALAAQGCVIYPGKVTKEETFRIGCIGDLHKADFERLLKAVEAAYVPGGRLGRSAR